MQRNAPTPEGRELGAEIARLCDQEEAKQAKSAVARFPERCRTCAFRGGTFPNGCGGTLMDALKCLIEGHEFRCHEHDRLCAGYQMMKFQGPPRDAHWPWFTTDSVSDKLMDGGK